GIDTDSLSSEQPVLASCYSSSVQGLQTAGNQPGQPTLRLVGLPPCDTPVSQEAAANVDGFNVHAKQRVHGRDKKGLERLCRYLTRPPLAQDRLELLSDGCVRYTFKKPWSDGSVAIVLEPLDFIARLCALVPSPRFHMLRFHGVLARHATLRKQIVPPALPPAAPSSVSQEHPYSETH